MEVQQTRRSIWPLTRWLLAPWSTCCCIIAISLCVSRGWWSELHSRVDPLFLKLTTIYSRSQILSKKGNVILFASSVVQATLLHTEIFLSKETWTKTKEATKILLAAIIDLSLMVWATGVTYVTSQSYLLPHFSNRNVGPRIIQVSLPRSTHCVYEFIQCLLSMPNSYLPQDVVWAGKIRRFKEYYKRLKLTATLFILKKKF